MSKNIEWVWLHNFAFVEIPFDCKWSDWSSWKNGISGFKVRTREKIITQDENGTNECNGDSYEIRQCNRLCAEEIEENQNNFALRKRGLPKLIHVIHQQGVKRGLPQFAGVGKRGLPRFAGKSRLFGWWF